MYSIFFDLSGYANIKLNNIVSYNYKYIQGIGCKVK